MPFDRRWLIADLPAFGARLMSVPAHAEPRRAHGVMLLVDPGQHPRRRRVPGEPSASTAARVLRRITRRVAGGLDR